MGLTRTAAAMTKPERLGRRECLELLQRGAFVGRVCFLAAGAIEVMPVNFLADGESLVFCTAAGTKLSALAWGADVVFEIDESRAFDRSGWSVVVRGKAREVIDPTELEYLRRGPLHSWAVTRPEHWIRVSVDEVSGVRLSAH